MVRFRLRVQLQEYELPFGATIVGRGVECNLSIADPLLSREHVEISTTVDRVTLRDLGSRNGTYVNGVRVVEPVELHHGDRIRFGSTEAVFGRTVTPRRDLVTTAGFRNCRKCGGAFVHQAPCCPRCGEAAPHHAWEPPRTESQAKRDFWLSLVIALLDKALSIFRYEEAEAVAARVAEKLEALRTSGKEVALEKLEEALCAVLRLARARGNAHWISWTLDTIAERALTPGDELSAGIGALPPILLEEALDPLERAIEAIADRDDLDDRARARLRALEALALDVRSFRRRRLEPSLVLQEQAS
jgi:hypothetical protein